LTFPDGSNNVAQGNDVTNPPEIASPFPLGVLIDATSVDQLQYRATETILLVEDETFVRKAAAAVLLSAGYRVAIAASAAQALEIQRGSFGFADLLLADVVLPGLSGHELAAQFRMLHPEVRILLMSGYAEQLTRPAASSSRAEFLAKPFSTSTLLRRVREVLDGDSVDFGASA
jgi:DNA-binding NtrC family response regulator